MIGREPISLLNTGLPLLVLALLAIALPVLLVPKSTMRHWEVAVAVWASAGFLLLAGAAVFGVIYGLGGVGVKTAFAEAPLATSWFFLKLSGYAAVAWVPVLGLTWLTLAQRVERRKGEEALKRGDK